MTRKIPAMLASQNIAINSVVGDHIIKPEGTYTIHTSLLFDPHQKNWLTNVSIGVDRKTGLISSINTRSTRAANIEDGDLDLRDYTVLPGFVDAHTHIFLHQYSEASSINQERDESFVERVVRATNHCRKALLAGYTTYRDLGTEGLFSADVSLRDSINRGLIPGPRLLVATEALASSSGYAVRTETSFPASFSTFPSQLSTHTVRLADPCDGVDECRAAVRRRLGAGADVIKFYADYRRRTLRFSPPAYPGGPEIRHPPADLYGERNPVSTLFTQEEMDAIVSEAKRARCPVAAHAVSPEGVIMAAKAGVTTIEHGIVRSDEAVAAMKEHGTMYVPTLSVVEMETDRGEILHGHMAQALAAYKAGVPIVAGGDTGAFPHGDNVREVELLVEAGLPLEDALVAATLEGWRACGGDWCGRRFGGIKEGWSADFVAVEGDVRESLKSLRRVRWVFKDGEVVVKEGAVVGL